MKRSLVLAIMAIAVCGMAFGLQSPQQLGRTTDTPPVYVPGHVFAGDYLRVGLNDFGAIGVGSHDPGVGLQWVGDTPYIFPTTESLAVYTWAEGYFLGYTTLAGPFEAFYIANQGLLNPALNKLELISVKITGLPPGGCIPQGLNFECKEVVLQTTDKNIQLTFRWDFDKTQPVLNLRTTLKNIGRLPVGDVLYKRIADFDVLATTTNDWTSGAGEASAMIKADQVWPYAGYFPPGMLDSQVRLTIAGHDGLPQPLVSTALPVSPSFVDLWAWDDMMLRSPGRTSSEHYMAGEDCNAGLVNFVGLLLPGHSRDIFTIYQTNFPHAP